MSVYANINLFMVFGILIEVIPSDTHSSCVDLMIWSWLLSEAVLRDHQGYILAIFEGLNYTVN